MLEEHILEKLKADMDRSTSILVDNVLQGETSLESLITTQEKMVEELQTTEFVKVSFEGTMLHLQILSNKAFENDDFIATLGLLSTATDAIAELETLDDETTVEEVLKSL